MARPRKPLELQTGNLTVEQRKQKELEESLVKAKEDNIRIPTWLKDKTAKKEFNRIATEMKELNIITNLDVNNLAGYCESFSNYIKATTKLNKQELTIQKCMPNGSYTYVENPLIKIQKLYAEEMRKFAGLVGLTIDSRLRFASIKVKELKDEIEDEFGDI